MEVVIQATTVARIFWNGWSHTGNVPIISAGECEIRLRRQQLLPADRTPQTIGRVRFSSTRFCTKYCWTMAVILGCRDNRVRDHQKATNKKP
jgi:hypothetical protein